MRRCAAPPSSDAKRYGWALADLLASGELPPSRDARDPWGGAFEIVCEAESPEITVHSAGPDRTFGTADDITG